MSDKSSNGASIYDLKLHEYSRLANGDIFLRVAGGWIYTIHRLDCGQMNSVFVPFSEEFQLPY